MKNKEIAKIFLEMADYLQMEDVAFKPYAYQRAADSLEGLDQDVVQVYEQGGCEALEKIPGVGKNIAKKIEEYLKTGKIREYQKLKKKRPINLEEIIAVEGLGPRKARILYEKLRIKNLKDLERAAKSHKIAPLFGFGQTTEKNILQGIAFLKRSKGRFLLGEILPRAREICQKLKQYPEVKEISLAGSLRRRKETIADIDILIVSGRPGKVMELFVSLAGIVKVWSKGRTKSSVRLQEGFDVDLRIVPRKSYGSALQYFTGSKEHNIATRRLAIDKGLKLNEYGVFRGKRMIAGRTEKDVYKAIGIVWMPPELRESQGEIEAAQKGRLPKLIDYSDMRGDLHCHSVWDGGVNPIDEMAGAAIGLGYEYLGISDHTKFLRIEHGLNERQLDAQRKEINRLNSEFKIQNSKFRILQGAETNILKDGSIDIKDEALKKLDYALAGVHSNFKMSKKQMTERIIRAMKNPYINIISHPTGRLLKKRDEYQVDFDKILRVAKDLGVILEINAFPERLDLNDQKIRQTREAGVKLVINTDSHQKNQLRFMEYGLAQARRGWAEKKDIINSQPLKKMLEYLRK